MSVASDVYGDCVLCNVVLANRSGTLSGGCWPFTPLGLTHQSPAGFPPKHSQCRLTRPPRPFSAWMPLSLAHPNPVLVILLVSFKRMFGPISCDSKVEPCGDDSDAGYTDMYVPEPSSPLDAQYDATFLSGDDADIIYSSTSVNCTLYLGEWPLDWIGMGGLVARSAWVCLSHELACA